MCINYDGPMSQMRRVKGLFAFLSEKTPFQKGLGILEKKHKNHKWCLRFRKAQSYVVLVILK